MKQSSFVSSFACAFAALAALVPSLNGPIGVCAAGIEQTTTLPSRITQFVNPKVDGLKVDYCRYYMDPNGPERRGVDCGQPAADAFCRTKAFTLSSSFTTIPYQRDATITIGDNLIQSEVSNPAGPQFHTYFSTVTCVMQKDTTTVDRPALRGSASPTEPSN